jgi:hypothetical protein
MVAASGRARSPLYRRADGMLSGFRPDGPFMPPRSGSRNPLPALALLLLGSVGIAAAWVLFALASDRQLGWMAVAAAFDATLMLRLGRMRPGWSRAACAVLGTALAIMLANWGIVASQVGKSMALLPWESMFRLGPDFIWTLTLLANDRVDFAWGAAALVVAAVASR